MIETKRVSIKSLITSIVIASLLQWLVYALLIHANLGSTAECFSLAQVFVVLLVAPYLASLNIVTDNTILPSTQMFFIRPILSIIHLLKRLIFSQIPLLCWVFLSTGFTLSVNEVGIGKVLSMIVVLTLYSISAGAVGMWCARVFKDAIFGTEFAYFIWGVVLGSVFILKPLGRYIDNIQHFIQPVLNLNPLIAVCNIFDGLDILRNPLLYELTPITYYVYSYPPWYVSCFWQLVIGGCCFLWTWQLYRSTKFAVID